MQPTRLFLDSITAEIKERDSEILNQKEKLNVVVNELKSIVITKLPKETSLSMEYQSGWNEASAILKQRLELIILEATGKRE